MCLDAPRLVGFVALVEHAQDGMVQPWIGQGDLTAQPEPRAGGREQGTRSKLSPPRCRANVRQSDEKRWFPKN